LEKSGADPKNCFFIDDKLENLKTTKDLGIKTIWKRIGKSNSFSIHNFKPDFTITSLLELKKILV